MTGTSNTAGHELKFLPVNGPITGEVKTQLKQIFANDDTTSLANSAPRDLFDRLESGGLNPDTQDFLAIATAMIKYLQDSLGIKPAASPNLSKEGGEGGFSKLAGVIGEALAGKKQLHEYTSSELLDMLIEGKFGRFQVTEVIGAFRAKQDVGTAHGRANGVLIVVNANGTVRKDDTLAYIDQLQSPFARVLEEFKGKEITTLDRAFKRKNMVAINYLTTPWSIEQIGVENAYGYDLGELIDRLSERAKMVAWAATTGHETMQGLPTDKYGLKTLFKELFREKLEDARLEDMRRAYKRAVSRGDLETQRIILKMTEEQALARLQLGGATVQVNVTQQPAEPVRGESYYRQLLEEKASLNPSTLSINGTGQYHNGGVYEYIRVSGTGCQVTNVVILKGGNVSGTGCYVQGTTAPRVAINAGGTGSSVSMPPATYESICRQLGLA